MSNNKYRLVTRSDFDGLVCAVLLKDLDLIRKIEKDGYKLQNFNLKNPDHVYALHILVKAIGIKDASLEKLLLGKNNPETLPNILFDITAKDINDITSILPKLKQVGYKPENVHLTWVLTNYVTAMYNNKNRARMVPEDILLKTHEGASNTIWGIVTKALPKGMNGRVDVILNNPEHTVFFTDKDGRTINGNVKGFLSLPLKKEKGGIYAEKVWKDKLFKWVKGNAPESITANMKESVNEGKKRFYQQDGIGRAKYTISYHDGKSKHKDGSDFYGIQILKNKKELEKFRNDLLKKGYREDSGFKKESVNEGYGDWVKAKNLNDIIKLSKQKKNATFYVTDDNNSRIGSFYLKNGKFAKVTSANPNYDFQNSKTKLRDRSDVIYKYKVDESVVNEADNFAGWIAIDHRGKKIEIKKGEAKDLYNAKLLAIKKLKVPKSKVGLLAIKPAVNESAGCNCGCGGCSTSIVSEVSKELAFEITNFMEKPIVESKLTKSTKTKDVVNTLVNEGIFHVLTDGVKSEFNNLIKKYQ